MSYQDTYKQTTRHVRVVFRDTGRDNVTLKDVTRCTYKTQGSCGQIEIRGTPWHYDEPATYTFFESAVAFIKDWRA